MAILSVYGPWSDRVGRDIPERRFSQCKLKII